jgi:hypothetical protein
MSGVALKYVDTGKTAIRLDVVVRRKVDEYRSRSWVSQWIAFQRFAMNLSLLQAPS